MTSYRAGSERLVSVEEFERLPDDGYRAELVRGLVVREPRPGGEHGWVVRILFRALDGFTRQAGVGEALIETGFRLSEHPPTVRGPDVAFIATDRMPEGGASSRVLERRPGPGRGGHLAVGPVVECAGQGLRLPGRGNSPRLGR